MLAGSLTEATAEKIWEPDNGTSKLARVRLGKSEIGLKASELDQFSRLRAAMPQTGHPGDVARPVPTPQVAAPARKGRMRVLP